MLSLQNLTAGYDKTPVIKDVTFTLDNGLCVLLGQNGSGKTTLLRAVCGSVRPSAGKVLLDGEDLLTMRVKERARQVAFLQGTHQTLSGITGEALVHMAFTPRRGLLSRPLPEEDETVRLVAEQFGATRFMSTLLDKMSAGERQMVELVAAVCQGTKVLLLDEPTSALDFNRTHEFLAKARALAGEKILLATLHDPALALTYADRILLFRDGCTVGDFEPKKTSVADAQALLRLLYPGLTLTLAAGKPTVLYDAPKGENE